MPWNDGDAIHKHTQVLAHLNLSTDQSIDLSFYWSKYQSIYLPMYIIISLFTYLCIYNFVLP